MLIGIPKESFPDERRVAMVPLVVPILKKAGFEVLVESGAGDAAGYPDAAYTAKGARIVPDRPSAFQAGIVIQVLCYGSNDRTGKADLPLLGRGQILVGFLRPLGSLETVQDVLLAAETLPRVFPMLTTAAGTITPARVFVIGAGVAGLQAIATARRLGAVASAYDMRPAAKEQVQSLGGRFVELPIEAKDAEDARGYAKAQDETFYRRQRELLGRVVAESDVVITAAVVPGRKSPVLVTAEMVGSMAPGSVIVDLAAERGGNCELTRPGQIVVEHGVTIIGQINLASSVPYHASQMYARNVAAFVQHLFGGGKTELNMDDEITRETLITRGGEVVNARVREFFKLPALVTT
ncbi:MAG: NAD(P)(+) transhydrogenase (Re/Si-specific) subunit alpha [Acidobacteria bacterium]|nr:MAG: NAD(P)(+) transhydrogenase (Re/Si-specific) subunit alpha [Acidobacteriota bacterium]